MHRLPAFCPNSAPLWLLRVWVGRPENAAHRQAAVRNRQGCERITPHSRALSGLGAPPAHDRPHISAAQDPAPGPLFGQEEGALERPPFRDAAIGLASARAYLGLRGAFATLTRQGWAAAAVWFRAECFVCSLYHMCLHICSTGTIQFVKTETCLGQKAVICKAQYSCMHTYIRQSWDRQV